MDLVALENSANALRHATNTIKETVDALAENAFAYKKAIADDVQSLKEDLRGAFTDGLEKVVGHFDRTTSEIRGYDACQERTWLTHSKARPWPLSFRNQDT